MARQIIHIDVGGEGRYSGAINLNRNGFGMKGNPIPNLVRGFAEKMPFASRIADLITVENTPLTPAAIKEVARVVRPGGLIRLYHPQAYGHSVHAEVIRLVGGRARQVITAGALTTYVFSV